MKLPVRMLLQHSGKVTIVDASGRVVRLVQDTENNYVAAQNIVTELNAEHTRKLKYGA